MTTDPIVAALDIGTAHTTAIVAAVHGDLPRAPMLKVLGIGRTRTVLVPRIVKDTHSWLPAIEDFEPDE